MQAPRSEPVDEGTADPRLQPPPADRLREQARRRTQRKAERRTHEYLTKLARHIRGGS
jgi:hypothetical protein